MDREHEEALQLSKADLLHMLEDGRPADLEPPRRYGVMVTDTIDLVVVRTVPVVSGVRLTEAAET